MTTKRKPKRKKKNPVGRPSEGRTYQLTVLLNGKEKRTLSKYLKIVGANGNEQSSIVRTILFTQIHKTIKQ